MSGAGSFLVAVLDDYQRVARSFGPWPELGPTSNHRSLWKRIVEANDPLAERILGFLRAHASG